MTLRVQRKSGGNYCLLGLLFCLSVFALPPAGCGGGSSEDENSDDDVSNNDGSDDPVASTSAEDTTVAAVQTTLAAISAVSSGSLNEDPPALKALKGLAPSGQKTITVTEAMNECEPFYAIPTLSGISVTVNGANLGTGGSGSCTVTLDTYTQGELDSAEAVLSCTSFTGGDTTANVTIDGDIGMIFSSTFSSDVDGSAVTIYAPDLLMGFIENGSTRICDIVMDIYETIIITMSDTSITARSTTSGCISVCGESFNVSGDETQTVSLEN